MEIKSTAFDYNKFGHNYSAQRQTDPRLEKIIHKALGSAKTVINVGAGSGSYEPTDRYVLAVEPSLVMRSQRDKKKAPVINATIENLPFDEDAFDAAMAMITIHHWPDIGKGLKELRRVAKERVVILTCDPAALAQAWMGDYFKELIESEAKRFPSIDQIKKELGGKCESFKIPVPFDCVDGFIDAFYGRPEFFLKPEVRRAQSSWAFLQPGMEEVLVKRLADDLESGQWDKKFGGLRTQAFFEGSLTLVVSEV